MSSSIWRKNGMDFLELELGRILDAIFVAIVLLAIGVIVGFVKK